MDVGSAAVTESASNIKVDDVARRIVPFLALLGQLLLLVAVTREFQIISGAFLRVLLIATAGFSVHYFLPQRLRLGFFLVLSLASIVAVIGFMNAAWLIGVGLALVATCHLPLPFAARVVLLFGMGALLTTMRAGWIDVPALAGIWPVLGSMYMFRTIIYMYDIRHEKEPVRITRTLSYFFMMPNICFPLFPVIDYQRFKSGYYSRDAAEIYQKGINWMVRGVIHLLLYRVVYQHLTLAPSEVLSLPDLLRYLSTTFLLYLQVSGMFHLTVGMLHLFGFDLPATNNRYCLSSSFNDFWRRINIYWKDFMLKVFYYPVFFRLRRFGNTKAIVLATFIVFVITWMLHSYQWFWLRGSFPLQWQDGIYWMTLALLVVANSLWEIKFGRRRSLTKARWTPKRVVTHSLKVLTTMSIVLVLWSLWGASTWGEWMALWTLGS